MINPLGTNPLDRLAQIKEQADLKSQISKLSTELQSASTQDAKAKIGAQLQALAAQSGQSLQSFGVDTGSIFSPNAKPALMATQTAAAPANSAFATETTAAGATNASTPDKIDVSAYQDFKGIGSVENGVAGRSDADMKRDKAVIGDLNTQFGISKSGDQKSEWEKLSLTDSRIKIYDGKTGELKKGSIKKGDIVQVESTKHGLVKFQAGGDGAINGRDDRVLAVGTQTAAQGVNAGLNNINEGLATAQVPQVQEAQQLAKLQVAANPQLNNLANQNPYQLSDADIKNLLAAIMQLVNQSSR
ncbi:MAG: hypothetical protein ACD_20C00422G0001 [uncultured bacterium]|nr:MAG: hypothetical protein ACD_20C00422G0001 [uncultured bacterium]